MIYSKGKAIIWLILIEGGDCNTENNFFDPLLKELKSKNILLEYKITKIQKRKKKNTKAIPEQKYKSFLNKIHYMNQEKEIYIFFINDWDSLACQTPLLDTFKYLKKEILDISKIFELENIKKIEDNILHIYDDNSKCLEYTKPKDNKRGCSIEHVLCKIFPKKIKLDDLKKHEKLNYKHWKTGSYKELPYKLINVALELELGEDKIEKIINQIYINLNNNNSEFKKIFELLNNYCIEKNNINI